MRAKTRAGRAAQLRNLPQNQRTHTPSAAFAEPSNAVVAALKAELEAGLRHDRGLEDGRPLPVMDQVRLVVLAGKLAKLQAMDSAGSVDRWLRLAPNHARLSSRVPGYVTAWQHLNESCLSLAAELGLTVRDQVRAGAGRVGGMRNLGDLIHLANEPLEILVTYKDDGKPVASPEATPASTEAAVDGAAGLPASEDVSRYPDSPAPAPSVPAAAVVDAPADATPDDAKLLQIVDGLAAKPPSPDDPPKPDSRGWPWEAQQPALPSVPTDPPDPEGEQVKRITGWPWG